jgi:hypothetical protein
MKHTKFIILLTFVAIMFGCAKASDHNGTSPEGVSQGNGLTTYASKYKYTISYKAELQLIIKSDREIEINDSTLIKNREDLSRLSLKVLDESDLNGAVLNTADELLTHLTKKEPLANWKKSYQPGSLGYYSEVSTRDYTNTDYYFFSEEKNVIFGRMLIANNSSNAKYIKSIISSFAFDYTSPTVSDLKLESSSIKSGDYAKLLFKASDDISGLNLDATSVTGIFALNQNGGGSEFSLQGEEIESLGDHWYSVKFKVENYLKSGSYSLVSFCIKDNVGNRLAVSSRSNSYCRAPGASMTQAPMPIINLEISNPNLDALQESKLNGIKLANDKIKAGQQGTLLFRATNIHLSTRFTGTFASYKNDTRITIDTTDVVSLADDWYSIKFDVSKRLPQGSYALVSFALRDRVGIQAALWGRSNGYYVFQGRDKKYVPTVLEMVTIKIK